REREDSYKTYEHDGHKYIGVYTKTNPCALEKVVTAAATGAMTDTYPEPFALEGQDTGGANSGVDTNLKIASFNIQGASHKKEAGRDWQADLDKSMDVITNNSIGIVGLQEFQKIQHDYFMDKMGDTYSIYPSTPEYGRGSAPPSVNSIIWDKSRFSLVKGGIQPGLKYFNGSPLHAPWVLLQDNQTYQQFYVLNTHDPAHPENTYFRYFDANKHVDFVNSLKAEGVPIFFTGDFNSGYKVRGKGTGNPTYQGKSENLTYCIMTEDGYLKDAYDLSEDRLRKCPQPKGSNSVDHIFMSSEVKLNSFSTEPPSVNGSDVHDTLIADVTIPGSGSSNTFTVATYNLLNADGHTAASIHTAGGCNTREDRACIQKRSELQAKIITGQDNNPAFDLIGTQETSPDQYRALKALLPNYDSVPSSNADINRMSQQKNGALSIFWNTNKFRKVDEGKAPAISNVASTPNRGHITSPWVALETATGQRVYVMSIHYPNSHFVDPSLGDAGTMREASKLTMQWVESVKQREPDAMVIVMGDFNDMPGQKLSYCIYTQDGYLQNTYDRAKGLSANKACPSTADSGKHGFSIDQIYASPLDDLKATNWTHMAGDVITNHASDHKPVYVTLRLSGGSN
ncbi:MAG TPA: endonuclease/exonuclease/phosphatase family protein, partial [Candidatus Saccharimonadales bacterium]|nr:endonuclease/exonuclease/phosphatase family protein [Candidatus Saccharimonadales bacterium]